MKQKGIWLLILLWIFWSGVFFYGVNQRNYAVWKEIQALFIEHPEFLPKKDLAPYTSFGFSNLRADIYWLEAIQYIGGNAIWSDYKKYLYAMLDLITELNPYFEKPYLIGQLLLPTYNERYEDLSLEQQHTYTKQAKAIGEKGIKNFCDTNKLQLIDQENDLNKLWIDPKYKNPCKTANISYGQGFLSYYYLKDPKSAAFYYKVASANDDGLEGAKIMAAIMNGKYGNRETSLMMFLTLASWKDASNECKIFWDELQKVSYATFHENIPLSPEVMKNIASLEQSYFPFDENKESDLLNSDSCGIYINKAIRELNLAYIEQENKRYFEEKWENPPDAKTLFEAGYLPYLPKDFQQYRDYGIIYVWNPDTNAFDYKMGRYGEEN